tara:strand:- start:591 stop:1028 length:438 start_codon:yes stop_codon:yes gene_type:complete
MRKIIFIILICTLYSCVSKKVITETKEVVKRDSIYIIKDRFITKQVNDTITIDKPCDSLGNLKSFDRVIKTNNVKITLKSVKGNIQATVNIDSIVNSRIVEFKQNYQSKVQVKETEVVRYRTPLWVWFVITLEALVILLLLRIRI